MKFHIFTNKRFLKNEPFSNQVVIDKIGLSCSKGKDCKILSINFAILLLLSPLECKRWPLGVHSLYLRMLFVNFEWILPNGSGERIRKFSFCIYIPKVTRYFAKVSRLFAKVTRLFAKVTCLCTKVLCLFAKVSRYFAKAKRYFVICNYIDTHAI